MYDLNLNLRMRDALQGITCGFYRALNITLNYDIKIFNFPFFYLCVEVVQRKFSSLCHFCQSLFLQPCKRNLPCALFIIYGAEGISCCRDLRKTYDLNG